MIDHNFDGDATDAAPLGGVAASRSESLNEKLGFQILYVATAPDGSVHRTTDRAAFVAQLSALRSRFPNGAVTVQATNARKPARGAA